MKKFNLFVISALVAVLATGCANSTEDHVPSSTPSFDPSIDSAVSLADSSAVDDFEQLREQSEIRGLRRTLWDERRHTEAYQEMCETVFEYVNDHIEDAWYISRGNYTDYHSDYVIAKDYLCYPIVRMRYGTYIHRNVLDMGHELGAEVNWTIVNTGVKSGDVFVYNVGPYDLICLSATEAIDSDAADSYKRYSYKELSQDMPSTYESLSTKEELEEAIQSERNIQQQLIDNCVDICNYDIELWINGYSVSGASINAETASLTLANGEVLTLDSYLKCSDGNVFKFDKTLRCWGWNYIRIEGDEFVTSSHVSLDGRRVRTTDRFKIEDYDALIDYLAVCELREVYEYYKEYNLEGVDRIAKAIERLS